MPLFTEHRLLRYTLAQIEEQRKKAGATTTTAPVNARAAQTASGLQNANAGTKGVRTGSNEFADRIEANVQTNYQTTGRGALTPEQLAANDAAMKLADANTFTQTPTNPAKGVVTAQQQTYANQAAGLNTNLNAATGEMSASGDGEIEQAAIDRMRRSGLSDEEIRQNLSDPEYMKSIQTTMSNTGLGGTDRQSAVLTTAQAQNILATSRNPKQRAEAQKVIDDQVNQVKGYDQVPLYDDAGNIAGYKNVENTGKTQENQQREKERLALEEANRLKQQEMADEHKKFVAGIDTSQLDQTKSQLEEMMSTIKNLSPDLQAAVLPQLLSLQQSNNEIAKQAQEIINAQPSDEEIEAEFGTMEEYIKSEDAKYKALLEKNLETSKEIANYNKEALEIEKKIIDHDAGVAEQKQIIANTEGEKKLRRQLNRLGIQTDISGLTFLQDEIQKGVTALENLKTGNNLVSLKAQLAIGEGYRLEVKQAMETYEGNYLNITSQTTERLQGIQNSISTAKSARTKEIVDAKKWELEQKQEKDKEARDRIATANEKMRDDLNQKRDDDTAKEALGWSIFNAAHDNYKGNIPKAILDRVGQLIPGMDVNSLLKTSSTKGGGSGLSFSISERSSDGKPAPLDQWMEQRQADWHKSTGEAGPASPVQRKAWEKEYNAKLASEAVMSPSAIMRDWRVKVAQAGNFSSVAQMEATQKNVEAAINRGDYKEARDIVDSIGAKPPEKSIAQVTTTQRVLNDLSRMEELIDKVEMNIGPLPTQGALWKFINENVETSPEYAELVQLRDSNLAPYSRGVSGEKGATTEPDVQRAISSLIDINSSPQAVRASLQRAKSQANESVTLYLQGMRDGGYRVKDLSDTYESGSWQTSTSGLTAEQQAWLDNQ